MESTPARIGPLHPFGAVRVHRDREAVVLRGFHDGFHLVLGELRILSVHGQAEHAAGDRDLDQIRAVLVTLPHGFARVIGAVHDALGRAGIALELLGPAVRRVRVAAGRGDRFAGRENAGSRQDVFVDRIAQSDGDPVGVAEVAHRSEAGVQRAFRIDGGAQRVVGRIPEKLVGINRRRGFKAQVRVHVHESRQHGGVAPIHDGVAGFRSRVTGHDVHDPAFVHEHGDFAARRVADAIDQRAAMNDGFGLEDGRDAEERSRGGSRPQEGKEQRRAHGVGRMLPARRREWQALCRGGP